MWLLVHNPYGSVALPVEIFGDPEDGHIAVIDGRRVNLPTMKPIFGQ